MAEQLETKASSLDLLRQLLTDAGVFAAGLPFSNELINQSWSEFQQVEKAFQQRYKDHSFQLLQDCGNRPDDYKIFLQSFIFPASIPMRILLIRLANHGHIRRMKIEYESKAKLELQVELDSTPYEESLNGKPDRLSMEEPIDYMLMARMGVAITPDRKPILYGPTPWAFPREK